jgi:spermidine synthase
MTPKLGKKGRFSKVSTVYSFLSSQYGPILDTPIDQIITLYRQAGWWKSPDAERDHVRRIIAGSHCFLVALENDELVGMGRVISDGESDAYIQDVTVKTTCRKKGIGTQIVKRLVGRIETDGLKWIGLIAERNTHEFYERIGFKKMPDSIPMLKES